MKLKVQLSIWCGVSCSVFYKAMSQMGGYLLPYDQLQLWLQLLEHENIDRADLSCAIQGPWESKMSWGIILPSWVSTAQEVEDNFNKAIRVGNKRLNITLPVNWLNRLPCWSSVVMLRPGLWRAWWGWPKAKEEEVSPFWGAPPALELLGSIPSTCGLHRSGPVP